MHIAHTSVLFPMLENVWQYLHNFCTPIHSQGHLF